MSLTCDQGYADFLRTEYRTAAKSHKCDECNALITPGMSYRSDAMVVEGQFDHACYCERCAHIMEALDALGFGWSIGGLTEAYGEYLEEYVTLTNGRTVEEQVEAVFE